MTDPQLLARVERACVEMVSTGRPVTFAAIATHAGVGRATLYRNRTLRTLIDEHRARAAEARTLSGLATEIAHLRTAVEEIAANVRRHEEQLRRTQRRLEANKKP